MKFLPLGFIVTGATSLMLGVSSAQAATLTIDNFQTADPDPTVLSFTRTGATSQTNTATGSTSSILGGEREILFQRTAQPSSGSTAITGASLILDPLAEGSTTGDFGVLTISNNPSFNSQATLTWDGAGSGASAAGLNLDLSLLESFDVGVEFVDLATGTDLAFTVVDNTGASSTVTLSDQLEGVSSFERSSFTGIDFSQVKSLALKISGDVAFDVDISLMSITLSDPPPPPPPAPVPEPSMMLGSSLALILGGLSTKRRKQQ